MASVVAVVSAVVVAVVSAVVSLDAVAAGASVPAVASSESDCDPTPHAVEGERPRQQDGTGHVPSSLLHVIPPHSEPDDGGSPGVVYVSASGVVIGAGVFGHQSFGLRRVAVANGFEDATVVGVPVGRGVATAVAHLGGQVARQGRQVERVDRAQQAEHDRVVAPGVQFGVELAGDPQDAGEVAPR